MDKSIIINEQRLILDTWKKITYQFNLLHGSLIFQCDVNQNIKKSICSRNLCKMCDYCRSLRVSVFIAVFCKLRGGCSMHASLTIHWEWKDQMLIRLFLNTLSEPSLFSCHSSDIIIQCSIKFSMITATCRLSTVGWFSEYTHSSFQLIWRWKE